MNTVPRMTMSVRIISKVVLKVSPWAIGVLDEPYSAKPAQRSSHTGPPGYIGWTRFQPTVLAGPYMATPLSGLSLLKGSSKIPAIGVSS
jgi:hypothetical protein